jgi:hypothetical protein
MEPREEWVDELIRRQDNIDPIRRIPNGALFEGSLIKGNLRLNKVQRIGAIFLGLLGLIFGCFVLVQTIAAVHSRDLSNPLLPGAILSPLSLWFGWRTVKNAWINDPRTGSRKG